MTSRQIVRCYWNHEMRLGKQHLYRDCPHLYRNNTIPGWDILCGQMDLEYVVQNCPNELCKRCLNRFLKEEGLISERDRLVARREHVA